MQVRLSSRLERYVRQVIAEGRYASAEEVVASALIAQAQREVREDVQLGLKEVRAGRVSEWDVNEAKQELLRRIKRKKKAS
jgi:putative addiction module CopG family antidote